MTIFLPIAEISVDIFLLLGGSASVGILSGLFGIGGGFLMTPILIFIGIPPAVAVATEANQIVGSSVSGALAHARRSNVDFKMGAILLAGGLVGSTLGVWLFKIIRDSGQIDLVIISLYVVFLSAIGILMFAESLISVWRRSSKKDRLRKLHQHTFLHGLPFKVRFRKSGLYVSAFLPLGIGLIVGILSAIMGVGGGCIMVPAMIYLLGMPTSVVVGTSLFQITFVIANVTILHAYQNQTVDGLLAMILLVGGVIGAQLGSRAMHLIRSDHLRGLLALIVLGVCFKLVVDLTSIPRNLYTFIL